jgi:hypothetical protein
MASRHARERRQIDVEIYSVDPEAAFLCGCIS